MGLSILCFTWYFLKLTGLLILCSLVVFISCIEFSSFIIKTGRVKRIFSSFLIFAFFLVFSFFPGFTPLFSIFLFLIILCYLIFSPKSGIQVRLIQWGWWAVGFFYCGILPGIVMLGIQTFGNPYFLSLLFISFFSDTFAYFGGRFFGRRPLAPLISPKKTIEGGLTGLVAGTIVGFFCFKFFNIGESLIFMVMISLVASFFSQVGDLFESMIKRCHGIKDSGTVMPGHGGILDRIDSVLFTGPVLYVWLFFI